MAEVLGTAERTRLKLEEIAEGICYHYQRDCSTSWCNGYGNCMDFESKLEVMQKRKFEKNYKLI